MTNDTTTEEVKPIVHSEMVTALVKPGRKIIDSLTAAKADLWHMGSCVPGEAAELAELMLAVASGQKPMDMDNLKEELGDIEFYVERIRQIAGITRPMVLETLANPANQVHYDEEVLTTLAIVAAAGQVFDAIKRHVIYEKGVDFASMLKALAQLEMHMDDLRVLYGVTHEETLEANIAKLRVRYEKMVYCNDSATARADKA